MTALNRQIVVAFEEENLTVEEIAENFGEDGVPLEVAAVKAALMQSSSKFRKLAKAEISGEEKEPEYAFTDFEAIDARGVMANLMRYSDDENIQFKAAKYILDDKKGRLDAIKNLPGMNFNVLMVNDQMKKAIAARERTASLREAKTIDLPANPDTSLPV